MTESKKAILLNLVADLEILMKKEKRILAQETLMKLKREIETK